MNVKKNSVPKVKIFNEESKENIINAENSNKINLISKNEVNIGTHEIINSPSKENELKRNNYNENLIENLENEIEQIVINLYNNRYNNYENKDISLTNEAYHFFIELKNYCVKSDKPFSIYILKILSKKMHSLIDYINNNLNYEIIDINDLIKIRNCIKNSGNDIEKVFEPALKKIEKNFSVENILIGIFINVICLDKRIIESIGQLDNFKTLIECNDKKEYEKFEEYLIKENNKNEINNSFEQMENNGNFDFNEEDEEKESDVKVQINNNNNIKANNTKNINIYSNIDDLLDYINDGEIIKKSKKKKKKNKKNKIDNVVYEENNLSDDNDPIVENFKHDLNDFSFHDNNKKIKPNFSKKWLTKIERMIN